MKIRTDFVTNSSSTPFTIINKTNQDKTLIDFVEENMDLLYKFNDDYYFNFREEDMLDCAKNRSQTFYANSTTDVSYGDEDGDILGQVYDLILRDGGESKSFIWKFKEYWR